MAGRLSFPRHRWLLAGVALAVVAAHLGLGQWLARSVIGPGRADAPPKPIQVAFVRELSPGPAPIAAPSPPRPLTTRPVAAPDLSLPGPEPVPEPPAALPEPQPEVAPAEVDPLDGPEPQPDGAAAFDWPPATRLLYTLTGQFRGPLHGSGVVEWLREDAHYQVRVTVDVNPAFTRQLVSDGEITSGGLVPRRYDEETVVPLRPARVHTLHFDGRQVALSGGQMALTPPGVQDAASQFVQLTWLFLTEPERLAVGESVTLPLALPRRVGDWTYDIIGRGDLHLPFGAVDAFHLVPRLGSARPGEFTVELWVAPSLQYLPVRLLIRQDAETWLDLLLKDKPLQAAPPPPSAGTLTELPQQQPASNRVQTR